MTNPKYANRKPLTDQEIELMLRKADNIKKEYFRLRVKALIGLLKKFGKRRIENLRLKVSDLEVKEGFLFVTFTLAKKHKKGFSQYVKWLEKHDPLKLRLSINELKEGLKAWQQTREGIREKVERVTKKVSMEDKYAKIVLEYYEYMMSKYGANAFLFPSGKAVFSSYWVYPNKSLSGRQLLRLIQQLNRKTWLHLFREKVGGDIAERLGKTIIAVTQVKNTLDLENEETAWRYVRRFAVEEMPKEV